MNLPFGSRSSAPSQRRRMNPKARRIQLEHAAVAAILAVCAIAYAARGLDAQAVPPTLIDPHLDVRTAASGFVTPVSLAFLGANNMLVAEKNTGRVQHVVNGVTVGTAI